MKIETQPQLLTAVRPPGRPAPGWLLAAALASALVVWLLLWYGETSGSMWAIWSRSDTFAHGFLIFPVAAWLVWIRRSAIAQIRPTPSLAGIAALAVLGMGWLLARLGEVQVVQQYALVAMIPASVLALLGWQTLRALAFPLTFLLLAVPVGEALIVPLMNVTADFTVTALRLSGIPVYREGNFFAIPSGRWSVVEGCSGVRYLIASFTGGCLFAYLSYRSMTKRLLFVGAAVVVPIIANWLRAYMIVMIGHLSDMRLAHGVDHLIYGWVFFGIVMLSLFWVGSFWRETDVPNDPTRQPAAPQTAPVPLQTIGAFALACVVVAGAWPLYAAHVEDSERAVEPSRLPPPIGSSGWQLDTAAMTDWRPRYLGADASLFEVYRKGDSQVALYLGVYRHRRQGGELVNSQNIMVVQKHRVWGNVGEARRRQAIGPFDVEVRQTKLRSPAQRLLIWDWYFLANRHLSDPYYAKIMLAWNRLLGRPGDGAAIIVATPSDEQTGPAEQTLRAFVTDMRPAIEQSLRVATTREK
jgi:exosortase A